jgi:FHS family L-fucose permease-like MFS transporter
MKTFELSVFHGSLTEASYWIAYFIFPIPIAMFMKRYSYKAGIIVGLLIAALGGLLFFPAASIQQYWAYLVIFFIIATGMCFLETAANPYVTVLGDQKTSSRRLNLAQSFNGLGAFIAAMFLSKLVLSNSNYSRETLPADYPGGWVGFVQIETDAMKLPYLILAIVLILIAVVFIFSHLPKIKEGDREEGDVQGEKLIDFSVFRHSNLRWGVVAQFFYNGGQTAINAMFLVYSCKYLNMAESTATTFFGIYMLAFLLGRWIGTLLMVKFKPQNMLVAYAIANMTLCAVITGFGGVIGLYAMIAVSFFMSIMYPTQFSLALKGLGGKTKSGSAFLVMAIVGNVILPPLTGHIMDIFPSMYHVAYIVPLICFAFCGYYGWKGYKPDRT